MARKSNVDNFEILEQLPVAIICIDELGSIQFANHKTSELFSIESEELIGSDIFSEQFQWGDFSGNVFKKGTNPLLDELHQSEFTFRKSFTFFDCVGTMHEVNLIANRNQDQPYIVLYLEEKTKNIIKNPERELVVKNAALDCSMTPVVISKLDGTIIYLNQTFLDTWGYETADELIGQNPQTFWDEWYRVGEKLPILLEKGELTGELVGIRKDKSRFPMSFSAKVFNNTSGVPELILASFSDISENISLKSERELSIELYHILSGDYDLRTTMQKVTKKIKKWSGCDAIGVRLKEGYDYPYFETRGFASNFVELERSLCFQGDGGVSESSYSGNPILECVCGNVLMGQVDSSLPFFTEEGSFWFNNTEMLLKEVGTNLANTRIRNRCMKEGYHSIALIPLKSQGEIYGLIQLNDKRKEMFAESDINTFEYLASIIALGLVQKRYQKELQESEARYRNYIEHSPTAVFIMDNQGIIVDVNPSAVVLTGFAYEEIVGHHFTEFSVEEERDEHRVHFQGLLKNKVRRQSLVRSLRKNKELSFWTVDTAILPNGHIIGFAQDITEQFKSRLMYKELFDNIPSGVVVYESFNNGEDFIIKDVNTSVEKIERIGRSQMIGMKLATVFPGVRQFGLFDVITRVWKTGITETLPVSLYSDSRISGWRENLVYKLPSGEVVTIYQDVTEKKVAESALRESESKLRAAFNAASNVAFTTIDPTGTECILDFSPGAENVFGYKREEILGSSFLVLIPEESRDGVTMRFNKVVSSGHACAEQMSLLNSDGNIFPAICSLHPIFDIAGQLSSLLMVSIDISEQKRAEEAFAKSEKHLRLMFTAAVDVAFIQVDDISGKITEFSPGASKIYGYSKDEIVGKDISILHAPEYLDSLPKIMETIRRSEVWNDENARMKRKNGDIIPVKFSVYPLQNDQNEIYAALGVSLDMSTHYEAENKIRQSLMEKESLLKEIHHRVKNNLNIVTSLLNLQAMKLENESPLQVILSEAINRIRSMAMVHERLYRSGNLSSIMLKEHIESLVQELRNVLVLDNRIEFDVDISDVGVNIEKAIPVSLIITELITNSVKHAFLDGQNGLIKIYVTEDGDDIVSIQIEDNGKGLPSNLDISKDGNLGFELLRVLVDQLHGKFSVMKTCGTCICISFPIS